jgi:hypothetical protein
MPDNASVTQANNSAVIDEISLYVYQSILEFNLFELASSHSLRSNKKTGDSFNSQILTLNFKP